MRTKRFESREEMVCKIRNLMFALIGLVLFYVWIFEVAIPQNDPRYVKVETLRIETWNAVKPLIEAQQAYDRGASSYYPSSEQATVNRKFEELKAVAKVTPKKFISLRARQLIEDQGRYSSVAKE